MSGPAAKDYLQESFLEEVGIELEWMDYLDYLNIPGFIRLLSIMCQSSISYLWKVRMQLSL